MIRTLLLVSLLCLVRLGWSQTYHGPEDELLIIKRNIEQFSQYVMDSNYEMIGKAYTADAKIMVTGPDIIEGRDNIVRYWTPTGELRIVYHKIYPDEISVSGDTAYDYGRYEGTTRRADGEEFSWNGKYVIIWKKVAGDWKIYVDIWNRTE